MADWRKELLGETGPIEREGSLPPVDKEAWERLDLGMMGSEEFSQPATPYGPTFSEMMIEEKGPMPDEFGNMTPVPSSDEEAVKQDFRRVLADGTIGDLRQYIEMNIGDLEFLAQTDNSIAKDLEAALRFISTGTTRTSTPWDQSRFQGVSPEPGLRTWGDVLGEDQNIAQKTFQPPPASGAAFASPGGWDPYADMEQSATAGELTPDVLPREPFEPFQTAPGYALGGTAKSPQTVSETMMAANVPPGEARLLEQFNLIFKSGSDDLKRDFINRHMDDLLKAAEKDPSLFNRIQDIIIRQTNTSGAGAGQLIAPPRMGEYTVFEQPDIPWSPNTRDAWAGMGSSFPGPSFFPSKGQTAPDFEALEEARGPMSEFAHGGYVRGRGRGRGTMPGELRRKGSLSVRVAGESMGEYDKRREDEDDVRPVRRTLDNALSPTLSRRMFS
jgi:hypothetical protein